MLDPIPLGRAESTVPVISLAEMTGQTVGVLFSLYGTRQDSRFSDRIARLLGQVRLSTLDQATAEDYARRIFPNCAPSTLRRQFYGPLISTWRKGAQCGWCTWPTIKYPRVSSKPQPRWVRPKAFDELVRCAPPHLVLQMHLLVGTGMRPAEMFALRWKDIDFEQSVIGLRKPDQVILMRPHIQNILEGSARRTGLVIRTEHGKPYASKRGAGGQSKTAVRKMRELAGHPEFGLSDLERSFAIWHLALYRDWQRLKEESGWSDHRLRWTRRLKDEVFDSVRDELLQLQANPPAGILSAGLFATFEKRVS